MQVADMLDGDGGDTPVTSSAAPVLDPRLVQVLQRQLEVVQERRKRLMSDVADADQRKRLKFHRAFLERCERKLVAERESKREEQRDERRRKRVQAMLAERQRSVMASTMDEEAVLFEKIRGEIWTSIVRNDIPRVVRLAAVTSSTRIQNLKKIAHACARDVKRTSYKVRIQRELPLRARRAMRDMLMYWRRNEKEDREGRKRAEKAEQERLRQEDEKREAIRQQRKLEFLITQTELYSHFVGKKMGQTIQSAGEDGVAMEEDAAHPTASADIVIPAVKTEQDLSTIDFANDDDDKLKARAARDAQLALDAQLNRTKVFDDEARSKRQQGGMMEEMDAEKALDELNWREPTAPSGAVEIVQPKMLMCQLKGYQLKGLNWLANLYEQGINGILADEMGLGKTVQAISLMAHLAETHGIWGPFLVVAPASTLHNWLQELARFVPSFKALPYWGTVKERQTLRHSWGKLYTKDAPFHILVTSYQLAVTDDKYFQRVKWQYMILDEAQAIKSSSSARWKTLLGFNTRNRLLLTGTPVQNSMKELWSLLHFIMPTLFDSHDEFSEWFSKDIEGHVENKSTLNEHQLRRLHMILKPFMLRRIKKHVQHELGDKIEIELNCELSARQRQMYDGLRRRVPLQELLQKVESSGDSESVDSLMNLVMQFRKVCNHPDLFERADVKSPFTFGRVSMMSNIHRAGLIHRVTNASSSILDQTLPRVMFDEFFDEANKITSAVVWDRIRASATLCELLSISQTLCHRIHVLGPEEVFDIDHTHQHDSEHDARFSDLASVYGTNRSWLSQIGAFGKLQRIVYDSESFASAARIEPIYIPAVESPPPFGYASSASHARLISMLDIGSRECQSSLSRADGYDILPVKSSWVFSHIPTISVPPLAKIIQDSGKLTALDKLLMELKSGGHRVLLYFQMTRMIDLMEEYLAYRHYSYLRLDGSSKISDRRDMVSDWQTRSDIFVFLLSTRAGGLGINLTAADTVIFYDSDWNPTVDQQAMDRAHRLGQTKQVTVYRLLTKGTIEERIRNRARQKDEIQKVVISGQVEQQTSKPVDFSKARDIAALLIEDSNEPI